MFAKFNRNKFGTFAPTPSQTVIKILLAHAAQQLLLVYQYDFKTAFLNSLIDEEEQIYVEQPHGFEVNEVNGVRGKYVCKLKKGLYGLKQSPRLWAATLTAWLLGYGFVAATSTDCLFIYRAGARAAGLVVLKYLATALQVADMFTKQIFPKHFERLRRVMMGHENFDDMCERYQDAKAAGDNVDDPKLYTVKPVRPPNG